LEGVVAKKLASSCRPGARNGDWLKVKVPRVEPFVIAIWMRLTFSPIQPAHAADVAADFAAQANRPQPT